jgi:hypothetical protein
MPDEIRGLIEEHGLSKHDFSCVLKEIPPGTVGNSLDSSSTSVYIRAWKRAIPTMDYIALEHGPGNYILVLSWSKYNAEENVHKHKREIVPITISEKCAAEHKKHRLDMKIKDATDTSTKVREAMVEKTIEGQLISAITGKSENDLKQTPKQYLEEIMGTVKMLGLPVGGFNTPAPVNKIEWDKILPAVVPLVTAFLTMSQNAEQRRSEENNKMFMLLLSQNQNASSQLMEMLKFQASKPAGENPLKDMQTMIMNALDIKQLLNPPQETISDKIFRVVETVAPQILQIAATAAQNHTRPTGIAVDMAKMYVKSDPDCTKLQKNLEEMIKFVNRLDDRIGWENADVVLGVVEWTRPDECVRDPEKRLPPSQATETIDSEDVAPE